MRPKREHATNTGRTYMVTAATWGRRALFRAEPWARLLIDTLYHYRESAYLLHAFVVMPDHVHVLITPRCPLEKAVQFIKGGFSYRVKKELGSNMEVWQKGFSDHRIRDAADFEQHVTYIQWNPVRKHICEAPHHYEYSSAHAGFEIDDLPRGLKPPESNGGPCGAPEGAPFQIETPGASEGASFLTGTPAQPEDAPCRIETPESPENACFQIGTTGAHEGAPFQIETPGASEGASFLTGTPGAPENARFQIGTPGTVEGAPFQSPIKTTKSKIA